MKLELKVIDIKKVQFAEKTGIKEGVLSVNMEEMRGILREDTRLGEIDIELANPGEKRRIARVSDAVEPRAKVGDKATDFPGAVGPQGTVSQYHRS